MASNKTACQIAALLKLFKETQSLSYLYSLKSVIDLSLYTAAVIYIIWESLNLPGEVVLACDSSHLVGQNGQTRNMLYRRGHPPSGLLLLGYDGAECLDLTPPNTPFWSAPVCSGARTHWSLPCNHSECVKVFLKH